MTSRERVICAFDHKQPDKVPMDFGGQACSGMNIKIVEGLRDYYGLEKKPVTLLEAYTMTGVIDEDLQDAMGVDCASAYGPGTMYGFPREPLKEWRTPWGQDILVPVDFNVKKDEKGGYFIYPQGDTEAAPSGYMPKGGYYFDAIERSDGYDEDDLRVEDNLEGIGIMTDSEIEFSANQVERASETGRYVIYGMGAMGLGDAAEIPGVHLKEPKGVRRIADWYMMPLTDPDFVDELFTKQFDITIENLRKMYERCGAKIDAIMGCAADFAHQNGLMVSIDTFKEVYMPHYKRLNDWIHQNTHWKVIKHNCGAVKPLIPHLIEAGFDALNPVQCTAADMDPKGLKAEFGQDILFWGGGVDSQTVLPNGSPKEVRKQALERCEIFGKDGGYVFNTVHNIQVDVPVENVVAMIDAVKEFNGDL